MTGFLTDGPADAPVTLVLAHGAGAPMDSGFMATFANGLGQRGMRVARFEFPYMAEPGSQPPGGVQARITHRDALSRDTSGPTWHLPGVRRPTNA